jgi:hypothetical protein
MVIVNDGLKNTRKWLAGSGGNAPTGIILGEGGTVASETDSALYSAVDSTEKGFAVVPTETDFTIQYEHTLSSTEGNGFNFREFVLTESVTDSIFSRDTFTTINKTNSFEVQTLLTVKLLNEE